MPAKVPTRACGLFSAVLDQPEDALAAIEEAVTIRRELAAARPDTFRPDLAQSLNNLSLRLAAWGGGRTRWPRSRKPHIYRELAAARPDAFRPDLATSLNTLSDRLAGLGRRRTRWPRSRKPHRPSEIWPRPARTRSAPTWPNR